MRICVRIKQDAAITIVTDPGTIYTPIGERVPEGCARFCCGPDSLLMDALELRQVAAAATAAASDIEARARAGKP